MELLRRSGMLKCKAVSTPMPAPGIISILAGDLISSNDATEYRSLVGGLEYLMITRPDLPYAINRVCQFLHAPRDSHMTDVDKGMTTKAHDLSIPGACSGSSP
jgi:histone deacetylase 1/2